MIFYKCYEKNMLFLKNFFYGPVLLINLLIFVRGKYLNTWPLPFLPPFFFFQPPSQPYNSYFLTKNNK